MEGLQAVQDLAVEGLGTARDLGREMAMAVEGLGTARDLGREMAMAAEGLGTARDLGLEMAMAAEWGKRLGCQTRAKQTSLVAAIRIRCMA
jgi:hypothetical protein